VIAVTHPLTRLAAAYLNIVKPRAEKALDPQWRTVREALKLPEKNSLSFRVSF